jgi:hypothetical protein
MNLINKKYFILASSLVVAFIALGIFLFHAATTNAQVVTIGGMSPAQSIDDDSTASCQLAGNAKNGDDAVYANISPEMGTAANGLSGNQAWGFVAGSNITTNYNCSGASGDSCQTVQAALGGVQNMYNTFATQNGLTDMPQSSDASSNANNLNVVVGDTSEACIRDNGSIAGACVSNDLQFDSSGNVIGDTCTLNIDPNAPDLDGQDLGNVLTHEMAHCYDIDDSYLYGADGGVMGTIDYTSANSGLFNLNGPQGDQSLVSALKQLFSGNNVNVNIAACNIPPPSCGESEIFNVAAGRCLNPQTFCANQQDTIFNAQAGKCLPCPPNTFPYTNSLLSNPSCAAPITCSWLPGNGPCQESCEALNPGLNYDPTTNSCTWSQTQGNQPTTGGCTQDQLNNGYINDPTAPGGCRLPNASASSSIIDYPTSTNPSTATCLDSSGNSYQCAATNCGNAGQLACPSNIPPGTCLDGNGNAYSCQTDTNSSSTDNSYCAQNASDPDCQASCASDPSQSFCGASDCLPGDPTCTLLTNNNNNNDNNNSGDGSDNGSIGSGDNGGNGNDGGVDTGSLGQGDGGGKSGDSAYCAADGATGDDPFSIETSAFACLE